MTIAGLLFELEDGRGSFLVTADSPPFIVGRRPPPGGVTVPSRIASREHVRIFVVDGQVFVEDAGSTGGAYLDGERLTGPTPIGPGARLQLTGDAVYVTRAVSSPPAPRSAE